MYYNKSHRIVADQNSSTQSRLLTTLYKKCFENIEGKAENAGNQHFLLSHNVFYPTRNKFKIFSYIILSSANAFKF